MPRLAPLSVLAFVALVTPLAAQVPQPPAPPKSPTQSLHEGSHLFNLGTSQPDKFALAAKCFAAAFRQVEMSNDQLAAWAYCRVRVAHDRLEQSPADARIAADVADEVRDALTLAPTHIKLQALGATVIADASRVASLPISTPAPQPTPEPTSPSIETTNFRVVYGTATAETATALAQAAESHRAAIVQRWTGRPATDWPAKCVVTLHASAAEFAQATGLPASQRGRAATDLAAGQVTARRLDFAADGDPASLTADVLPRELTHVILADLFPTDAPPLWAALGMAVSSTTDAEQARYRDALARAAEAGTLLPTSELVTLASTPADRATEFHVQSASVVYYLTKWRGETEFVGFLQTARRYGPEAALREVYGVTSLADFETMWKKFVGAK